MRVEIPSVRFALVAVAAVALVACASEPGETGRRPDRDPWMPGEGEPPPPDELDASVTPGEPVTPWPADEGEPDDPEEYVDHEPEPFEGDAPTVLAESTCIPRSEPAPAAGCPYPLEVVVWSSRGWSTLGNAFAENESPCANYFISIPGFSGDKTRVRPDEAGRMRARSTRLHPMAEFHWHAWNAFRQESGMSWRAIGHEFRRRMRDAGYCVESGDSWAINEAPTTTRSDPAVRRGLEQLVLGLYEGDPGMPVARGTVFVVAMGHATRNVSVYEPTMKTWLADAPFWVTMNTAVRFWSQETYTDPRFTCVAGSTLDARADRISEFAMHPARLAAAAPDSAGVNTAQSYLGRAYAPLLNGVWGSAPENGYGDTRISESEMGDFVSEQVYATRRWADAHAAPDGRIGFAFSSYRETPDWAITAREIARAIRNAYGRGNGPLAACYEGGVRAHCTCATPGAVFNPTWSALGTW